MRADKSTRKSGEHARNALLSVGARVLGVIVNDAPHRKGYEVYGGSYYGQPDVAVRANLYDPPRSSRRTLPTAPASSKPGAAASNGGAAGTAPISRRATTHAPDAQPATATAPKRDRDAPRARPTTAGHRLTRMC